mmetsp:Transcript_50588/g.133290  ORF Transcript_50588/g.133290 Transcript_50588/m.133290 type:complete len:314 (+) Transcript_50588:31-972(+)
MGNDLATCQASCSQATGRECRGLDNPPCCQQRQDEAVFVVRKSLESLSHQPPRRGVVTLPSGAWGAPSERQQKRMLREESTSIDELISGIQDINSLAAAHRSMHTPPRQFQGTKLDEPIPEPDDGAILGLPRDDRDEHGRGSQNLHEPANKVFVQFSNNLDGFFPCLLLLTEDDGLNFTCEPPLADREREFTIDPNIFIRVGDPLTRQQLVDDRFWSTHGRHVYENILADKKNKGIARHRMVHPPEWYPYLVALEAMNPDKVSGQLESKFMLFIAVQSWELAEDLVDGCKQLMGKRKQDRIDEANVKPRDLGM